MSLEYGLILHDWSCGLLSDLRFGSCRPSKGLPPSFPLYKCHDTGTGKEARLQKVNVECVMCAGVLRCQWQGFQLSYLSVCLTAWQLLRHLTGALPPSCCCNTCDYKDPFTSCYAIHISCEELKRHLECPARKPFSFQCHTTRL